MSLLSEDIRQNFFLAELSKYPTKQAVFPHIIPGLMLSDVVAVLGRLNLIAAELDR